MASSDESFVIWYNVWITGIPFVNWMLLSATSDILLLWWLMGFFVGKINYCAIKAEFGPGGKMFGINVVRWWSSG